MGIATRITLERVKECEAVKPLIFLRRYELRAASIRIFERADARPCVCDPRRRMIDKDIAVLNTKPVTVANDLVA